MKLRSQETPKPRRSTWRERNGIIVPGRFVDGHEMALPVTVRGRFTMRAKKEGQVVREREFDNIIVNQGLDRLGGTSVGIYAYCHVGTGTATPVATNTQLANFLISTTSTAQVATSTGAGVTPDWAPYAQGIYTFALGVVVGNLTEVGVAWGTAPTTLFSRALILDGSGVPTSFPIAADEQLEVTYRMYLYPPLADVTTTQVVGSTTYDVVIRPSRLASTSYWKPPTITTTNTSAMAQTTSTTNNIAYSGAKVDPYGTSSPTGSLGAITSSSVSAYTAGTYYRDGAVIWNPSSGNGNIKTVRVDRTSSEWQVEYQTPIVKLNTQTLTLPFRLAWGRH